MLCVRRGELWIAGRVVEKGGKSHSIPLYTIVGHSSQSDLLSLFSVLCFAGFGLIRVLNQILTLLSCSSVSLNCLGREIKSSIFWSIK